RNLQPNGPYYLLGACFGALVAFEMAQQLEAQGETVGLLVLMDPPRPVQSTARRMYYRAKHRAERSFVLMRFIASRLALYARTFKKLSKDERRAWMREKLQIFGGMVAHRDLFRGDRREFNQARVLEANLSAAQTYVPQAYRGSMLLFQAARRKGQSAE